MKIELNLPCVVGALLCLAPALLADTGDTERVSVSSSNGESDWPSEFSAVSATGRYVVFDSSGTTLVPGDTNGSQDVFVRDRLMGTTTRVSVSTGGGQGNHNSNDPAISADGRYVVFISKATNLVGGDTNGYEDAFLHDRSTGMTTRISVGPAGEQGTGRTYDCRITPDAKYVAFASSASNFVPGDTNSSPDIFVRELATGAITRVSVSTTGDQADGNCWQPVLSDDAGIVAFESGATNLVPGDTNGEFDVFVHVLASGVTTRVSVASDKTQGNSYSVIPAMSANGRFVAFESRASTLVPNDTNSATDIFLHDRQTGDTSIVSISSSGEYGNNSSRRPSMSADGRRIAFYSWSNNLVPGDTYPGMDVFVYDRLARTPQLVSIDSSGGQGNNHSYHVALSRNGRFASFFSDATNLVPGDTNGRGDIFLHDYLGESGCPQPVAYCTGKAVLVCGLPSIGSSGEPSASASSGFEIFAGPARGNKAGVLLYGDSGPASFPFQGGTLCIQPTPLRRAVPVTSGGTSGGCNGQFLLDMNAFASGTLGGNPAPSLTQVGQAIHTQWWGRDSVATGSFLSDALEYIVCQ